MDLARELAVVLDTTAMEFIQPLLDEVDPADSVEVVRGPLELASLYRDAGAALVVFGDLVVDGPLLLDEHAWLVVTGNVVARDVWATAALYVHGAMRVGGLVYLNTLNDYACIVGALEAPVLVEEGMHTTVRGAFRGLVFSCHNSVSTGPEQKRWPHVDSAELERVIDRRAFEPDERGNGGLREGLFTLLERGERVLARSAPESGGPSTSQ